MYGTNFIYAMCHFITMSLVEEAVLKPEHEQFIFSSLVLPLQRFAILVLSEVFSLSALSTSE